MEDVVTYAQNREDLNIASFFPDVERGFYVDVGAHHPVQDSVTKYFSLRGWTGINIEPQREYHALLEADRGDDVNLNIGVSDAAGSLPLREFPGGGLSTFSAVMKSAYEQDEAMRSVSHVDYEVKVETLANVLAMDVAEGRTIHFLKVDVEGLEYEVLRGNDWTRFRPILLCVEAIHVVKDWHQLLADASYDKVLFDGVNEYFLAREHSDRAELRAFAPMFLANKRIAPFYLVNQVEDLRSQLTDLQTEAAELSARNTEHADVIGRVTAEHADVIGRMTTEHADVIGRMTTENRSLHEAVHRLEQTVAELHSNNKSTRFHARSLYKLTQRRVATWFGRRGDGPQQSGASQERIAMAVTHVGAKSFLAQIDDFVAGSAPERSPWAPPPVVSLPLLRGRSLKARVANRLAYWPLRIVRRSTTDYWRSQQQVIFQLSQEIEALKVRVNDLSGEVQVLERHGSG